MNEYDFSMLSTDDLVRLLRAVAEEGHPEDRAFIDVVCEEIKHRKPDTVAVLDEEE